MRKLKKLLKAVAFLLVFRALAFCWVFAERQATEWAENKLNSTVGIVATRFGYELPREEPDEFTLELLAERYALAAGINPALVRAKIKVESGWNPRAISPAGAVGLMQVMPVNAKRCGLDPKELLDPEKNIKCGLLIFKADMQATRNDVVKALYRYNGGPKAVDAPPAESRKHAVLVLSETARDIRG